RHDSRIDRINSWTPHRRTTKPVAIVWRPAVNSRTADPVVCGRRDMRDDSLATSSRIIHSRRHPYYWGELRGRSDPRGDRTRRYRDFSSQGENFEIGGLTIIHCWCDMV
ncbi:hypothetical protein BHM03_00035367, partial [Ensete ventricosum]